MRRSRTANRWLLGGAAAVTAVAVICLQQVAQLRAGRNPLEFLRTEFWHDQLGYLAIAADVARGHFDNSEPVTTTGVSHYPRLYYSFVGVVARIFGLPTVVSWNLVSLLLQLLAVASVALVAGALARRWWVAFAAGLPFFTGTFAYLMSGDGAWYTLLNAHAVLWGPYGVLFSHNAETAGLCVGILAVSGLVWAWRGEARRATRIALTVAAAAAVGMLSSFQTYSFLSMTYLLVFASALGGILVARRWIVPTAISVALVLVVFAVGPLLAERVGQLPTLVFGMLPAAPGLVIAVLRSRGLVAFAAAAAAAAALPQIVYTMSGVVSGDPFLTYRVASNHLLGVVSWQALAGASVVLTALIGVTVTAVILRDRLAFTLSATVLAAMPLLALNDVWGANAEPYRFWIEGILLGSIAAVLGIARLSSVAWARPARSADVVTTAAASLPGEARASRRPRAAAVTLIITTAAAGVLWAAALPDWINSLRDGQMQAVWDPYTARENAIAALAREAGASADTGLLTTERCIDNRTAKVNSGAPIANYHLGMAWPRERSAIDAIISARDAEMLDPAAMRESDTRWLLTDSSCDSQWDTRYADILEPVASIDYTLAPGETISAGAQTDGTIRLWQLAP
jgi:hypothetical protein